MQGSCQLLTKYVYPKYWYYSETTIPAHTSNAKCLRNVSLINVRGLAEIIVPVRGYGRHSPNQVMIKRELLTDEVILSFS